ncbi:protein zwilch homolog isoform 1-T3 [Amazona ochrocephala]
MKCVSSYQELIACFTLVLESLECGEIQPWIHHGSGSLLSKLIQQSYHGKMEAVSLTGITPVQMLLENGLDKMKKDYVSFFIGVSSYQELIACFTLVLESLECGEIQPWIHHGSGSLLSKLIQQSYHGKMEAVSLTGITPVQMLLENGLDKMKKDYVSFFIGQELATLTSLDCFISTSVDLQEQVHCVQKLHHMLEIMVSCPVLLQFKHESLFPWTQ